MSGSSRVLTVCFVAGLLWAPPCRGQWSSDPAHNLVLADRSGAQGGAKIVARAGGGFYVSWLGNAGSGYDLYLQRLDASGFEMWPHNGVLVADGGQSYTVDYGLDIDTQGNALLAFRDDRSGALEITVARLSTDGSPLWGSSGVQVSAGGSVIVAKVAGTTDGNVVVAWYEDEQVRAQKLTPNGSALWGAGVTLPPPAGSYTVADLRASNAGNAIVSFVHSPTFGTNHLLAQKLASANGAPLWGSDPHVVYDAGSLQMASYPPFVSDGAGGAVFSWYVNSDPLPTYLDVRVQRVRANGTEAFSHQGVVVSTDDTRQRVDPMAAFLPATQETVVYWTEMNIGQSGWGVSGQKLDASGTRLWTGTGVEVTPIGGAQIWNMVTLPIGGGVLAAWSEAVASTSDSIRATCLDRGGSFVWATPIVDLKTSPTQASRMAGAVSSRGYAAFTWADGGLSVRDIVAQNLNEDGTLGREILHRWSFTSDGTDSVGGADALLYNGASVTGGALVLDGVDDYAELPIATTPSTLTDVSVEMWVNWTGAQSWERFFDFGNDTNVNWFMTPYASQTSQPRVAITTGGNSYEQRTDANVPFPFDTWTHVVFTLDGDGASNQAKLYLNGTLVGVDDEDSALDPAELGPLSNIWLGRSQYGADPYLMGALGGVVIYGIVLTNLQVLERYRGIFADDFESGDTDRWSTALP